MFSYDIYKDIATRTAGDIYLGVVGPVRTGKSTFIKRFMEKLVIDGIQDSAKRARAIDELPLSADGKTIMTTEPKFVPNEAIKLTMENAEAYVRLIDCVGYVVDGALGHSEGDKPRLVKTPWSSEEMPFTRAAEIGTEKVIKEHSTIGVVVTTDGSITDIPRAKYVDSEERVVRELQEIGKPFVVVLNSTEPTNPDTLRLADSLMERYGVPVTPMDVEHASEEDFNSLMSSVLMEFPVTRVDVNLPKWVRALGVKHPIVRSICDALLKSEHSLKCMHDCEKFDFSTKNSECFEEDYGMVADPATGVIEIIPKIKNGVFYKILAEECGTDIDDDYKLMSYMIKVSRAYKDYEKLRVAMEEVKESGYGVVMPTMEELTLEDPEIVKQGTQFGVKLKASAPSIHLMRVDVETEVSPIIGSEQQSADLMNYLMAEFENNKQGIWETNMFGKPLSSLVKEDLTTKISNMPHDAQKKLRRTVTRIINEGKGGVLCILL
ncbi:MAG: stage IV sporulation protein A [Clostridia bacterium]|nr:stage IV sporulation protein A [Clostridia bacterium]